MFLPRSLVAFALLALSAPAAASGAAQLPEASTLSLFALGILGVILGRHLSKKKSDNED